MTARRPPSPIAALLAPATGERIVRGARGFVVDVSLTHAGRNQRFRHLPPKVSVTA